MIDNRIQEKDKMATSYRNVNGKVVATSCGTILKQKRLMTNHATLFQHTIIPHRGYYRQ